MCQGTGENKRCIFRENYYFGEGSKEYKGKCFRGWGEQDEKNGRWEEGTLHEVMSCTLPKKNLT